MGRPHVLAPAGAGSLAANPAGTIAVKLPGIDMTFQGGRRLVARSARRAHWKP
jgi:hypothetical protein